MSTTVFLGLFFPLAIIPFAFFFSLLFHELGHATAGLLMTNGVAKVYLGSFGDSSHTIRLRVRRLELFIKYNPLRWFKGICSITVEGLDSITLGGLYIMMPREFYSC